MPYFSKISKARLATCHPDLQRLFTEVIKEYDCAILCGYRTEKDQEEAFLNGSSNAHWPDSPHNKKPSIAVDARPCPLDWGNIDAFLALRNLCELTARNLGISLKPILRFKNVKGQTIVDYPHFEIDCWKDET